MREERAPSQRLRCSASRPVAAADAAGCQPGLRNDGLTLTAERRSSILNSRLKRMCSMTVHKEHATHCSLHGLKTRDDTVDSQWEREWEENTYRV